MARGASRAVNPRRVIAAELDEREADRLDRMLGQIPIEARNKALPNALRAAGRVVVKAARANLQMLARTEYNFEDFDQFPPIKKTMSVVFRASKNGRFQSAFVGPRWPDGAPGHWIEYGFQQKQVRFNKDFIQTRKTPEKIPPRPFLRPAADSTKEEQKRALFTKMQKELAKYVSQTLSRAA